MAYWMADFETVVYDGQESTEVWASGWVELYTENAYITNNINQFMSFFLKDHSSNTVYFHNLKFDGSFILHYLHNHNFIHGVRGDGTLHKRKDMPINSYIYTVSSRGVFYSITVRLGKKRYLEFLDSYKLLPFSVAAIGKSFDLKHQKGVIDYKLHRKAFDFITDEEKGYLTNDLFVPKEALEMLFDEGHEKTTIGSCCLAEYKKIVGMDNFKKWFPRIDKYSMSEKVNNVSQDEFVRKSYRGGWCYCVEEHSGVIFEDGITLDVNSLYPFVMLSPYRYPVGVGKEYSENAFNAYKDTGELYYFVKITCRFQLKDGYLPFIQIKDDARYRGTEMLRKSKITMVTGDEIDEPVTLTLTKTDYVRLHEFYHVYDEVFVSSLFYQTDVGIFDEYILKYKKIKETSKGAKRTLAKLFSNNLYGKIATSTDSSYKTCFFEDGVLKWHTVFERNKKPIHVACGSAITSYARDYTIRTAQKNKRYFHYADTDSIHLSCPIDLVQGVVCHPTEYGCWKMEQQWKYGVFIRQKTYLEIDLNDEYHIACAGMPDKSKQEFIKKVKINEADISSFNYGLQVSGKLQFKQIKGGAVLVDTEFTLNAPTTFRPKYTRKM